MKAQEAADYLGVGIGRIRTYCRIAGLVRLGGVYDIPKELVDRWRARPPGSELDISDTVAGRALRGQPIAGDNYDPENDDVKLARAYRQLKLDLAVAHAELAEAKQTIVAAEEHIRETISAYIEGCNYNSPKDVAVCDAVISELANLEELI